MAEVNGGQKKGAAREDDARVPWHWDRSPSAQFKAQS
jgi:hypothetical protein